MNKRIRRLMFLSLLVAMASVVNYFEGLMPLLIPALPGAKLGLANVFSLFALVSLGPADAFIVVIVRCFLASAVWGQPVSLAYSLAGGLLSTLAMWGLLKLGQKHLSLYGVSAAGAFFHNFGQIGVAALILQSGYVFGYLPLLTVIAIPTGLFVGAVTMLIKKALDKTSMLAGMKRGGGG